jgi:ubiquinone/menaquinone biosynthesis C-methylase UbiE
LFLAVERRRNIAPAKSAATLLRKYGESGSAFALHIQSSMNLVAQTSAGEVPARKSAAEVEAASLHFDFLKRILRGAQRRLARERRRRKVGRAYDMALEIARTVPSGSRVLDVGCGNGFIAHHLSAMLGEEVLGIDVMKTTEAPIDYRRYDGAEFPAEDKSFDAVLLCYVLHHAQDVEVVLGEVRRVLRDGGLAIIYEDIPRTFWDKALCRLHSNQWKNRTGPCTFRTESEWREVFISYGFGIRGDRQLSRWRNLTHPLTRFSFELQLQPTAVNAADRQHTRPRTLPGARGPRRSNCTNRLYKLSTEAESRQVGGQFAAPPIP